MRRVLICKYFPQLLYVESTSYMNPPSYSCCKPFPLKGLPVLLLRLRLLTYKEKHPDSLNSYLGLEGGLMRREAGLGISSS